MIYFSSNTLGVENLYVLNDLGINNLYIKARKNISSPQIEIIKDVRGIVLRFKLQNSARECEYLSQNTIKNLQYISRFLEKIPNPVIIEVHTKLQKCTNPRLKNWEISTIIANSIEDTILQSCGKIKKDRLYSVGYGEFLPAKSTLNNVDTFFDRVDIIILCSINGE